MSFSVLQEDFEYLSVWIFMSFMCTGEVASR